MFEHDGAGVKFMYRTQDSNGSLNLLEPTSSYIDPALSQTPMPKAWNERRVQNLREAEDLLDCVVAQGYTDRELSILPEGGYVVRWRG